MKFSSLCTKLSIAVAIVFLLISYSVFYVSSDETIVSLAQEDGLYEYAGAFFFLVAAVLFFITGRKEWKRLGVFKFGHLVLIGLGFVFLFGFLEEISWGQRIFEIETPEALESINKQQELNIHNLPMFHARAEDGSRKLLSMERMFSLFWLGFCVLVPIAYLPKSPLRALLDKLSFPVVPLALGLIFPLNYLVAKLVALQIHTISHNYVAEVKECVFAFLFLLVSLSFAKKRLETPMKESD